MLSATSIITVLDVDTKTIVYPLQPTPGVEELAVRSMELSRQVKATELSVTTSSGKGVT